MDIDTSIGSNAADDHLSRLTSAMVMVASDLDLPTVLRQVVRAAMEMTGAQYGALGVIGDHQRLREFIFEGIPEDDVATIGELPAGHGILGLLISHPEPLRLDDLGDHPASFGFPEGHPPMGTFLGAPVRVGGQVFGNIYLTEKSEQRPFSDADEELLIALAAVVGTSIERSRLHDEVRNHAVLADRERIGRDLHDTVIQRLFATGLSLQAATHQLTENPEVAARIEQAIDELDETIRDVRQTIFELQRRDAPGSGLRRDLLALVAELQSSLDLKIHLRFDGPVESGLPDGHAASIEPVIREAISNVGRHAAATEATVAVVVAGGELTITVTDDGTGPGAQREGGLGLGNLAARARELGGTCVLSAAQPRGSRLLFQVPLNL